ncbi:ABC transporter permease [candidate division KSB1 bacterium]|nr:ABC transporter permease [candidate division KSB1 bacterium]
MINNYLKLVLRNIQRNKGYSFINIAGLVIGMTCFILIMLFVQYELSYDNFHENQDRIFRIIFQLPGEKFGMTEDILAITPAPLAAAMMEAFPEVESATRFDARNQLLLSRNEAHFFEAGVFADENFLNMFAFKLIKGDKNKVLDNPQNIVISQNVAKKFFGNDDPMGKTLTCSLGDFTVAGIAEDAPENSHIRFDWMLPFESQFQPEDRARRLNAWNWDNYYSFIKMQPGFDVKAFEEKLNAFIKTKNVDWEARTHFKYFLQPLRKVHLTSGYLYELGVPTDISLIRLFSAVAIFVLLIACINAVNLATANAAKRAKEIGIRKVVGSLRHQLFWQFTGESLFMSLLAFLLALALVSMLLPAFNHFVQRSIGWNIFMNKFGISGLMAVVILTGLISGVYPSLVLSAMKPVKILGKKNGDQQKGINLRNFLVLFQFSIAIVLMIASLVIFRQIEFIKDKDLGFNRDQILVVGGADSGLRENFEAFKNNLLQNPKVIDVTTSSELPTNINWATGIEFQKDNGENKLVHYQLLEVDYNFIDLFEMEMVQGRNFSRTFGSDSATALIVNETFVKQMDWANPIGKQVPQVWSGPDDARYHIVGVVKDFHARPLHLNIKPIIMRCRPNSYWIHIRIIPGNFDGTLTDIQNLYNRFKARYPFQHFFLDDQFNQMYQSEQKLGQILMYSNILAIFIACLGIFGLATYTAERRTKEIGIRKVLGASIPGIVSLLSWNFTKWVLIANIIAWPIAYCGMAKWLQNFTYRINLEWWTFVSAGFVTLLIALITVCYHSLNAAVANPVKSLRYE